MALSILIELSEKKPNWKAYNKSLKKCANSYFEFFPIPDFGNTGKNYVGISVLNRVIPDLELLNFKNLIKNAVRQGNKVVELYNSSELNKENIDITIDKLIK